MMISARSQNATDTLKGLAILAVLANHLADLYWPSVFDGFASLFIAIFFLLSGHGLAYSLERRWGKRLDRRSLFRFYYDRLVRLFPLYWLALGIQSLVTSQPYTMEVYLGLRGPGHFWFMPAILQCYALSPVLFALRQKRAALVLVGVGWLVVNLMIRSLPLPPLFAAVLSAYHLTYRNVFGLHWAIFLLGLSLPGWLSVISKRLIGLTGRGQLDRLHHRSWLLLGGCYILLGMALVKYYHWPSGFFMVLPVVPLIGLSVYALIAQPVIDWLAFLGRISYPIYLFHMGYYLVIRLQMLDRPWALGLTVGLFPMFLGACYLAERFGNQLTLWLRRFGQRFDPASP